MRCAAGSRSSPEQRAAPGAASPPRSARRARPSSARAAAADGSRRSDYDRPETIEETAELVTSPRRHGRSPIAVDHLEPDQVERLAERIRGEHGHIDVLVNDIWGGEVLKGGPAEWNTPIWKHDLDKGLRILRLAIDTHLVTSHHLLPLLIDQARRPARRGHRRHHRLQRDALPDLGVLRPRQGRGEPPRVLAGPRARSPTAATAVASRRAGCAPR